MFWSYENQTFDYFITVVANYLKSCAKDVFKNKFHLIKNLQDMPYVNFNTVLKISNR